MLVWAAVPLVTPASFVPPGARPLRGAEGLALMTLAGWSDGLAGQGRRRTCPALIPSDGHHA